MPEISTSCIEQKLKEGRGRKEKIGKKSVGEERRGRERKGWQCERKKAQKEKIIPIIAMYY